MATLATLRKQAKEAGVPASRIRSAEDADELRQIIKSHTKASANGAKKKGTAKKAVGKAVTKGKTKTATKPKRAKKAEVEAPKRRGRPPGSKNKTGNSAGSKSKPAVKSGNSGKAKRPTAAKATMEESGRNLLDTIDYRETEGWNAREGSAPDRIIKALRKFRGNREKVFDYLLGDIWDFVAKKRRDGSKNTRQDAEKMLRYRIARTDWDFAMRTGQHQKAENRAEYGTAGTGAGTFKPAGSKTRTKGNSTKTKTRATAKATPVKRGKKTEVKRGRPVGSKSKAKVKTRGRK